MSATIKLTSIDIASACDTTLSRFFVLRNKLKLLHSIAQGWSDKAATVHDEEIMAGNAESILEQRVAIDKFIVANITNDKSALKKPLVVAVDIIAVSIAHCLYKEAIQTMTEFVNTYPNVLTHMNNRNKTYFQPNAPTRAFDNLQRAVNTLTVDANKLQTCLCSFVAMAPVMHATLVHMRQCIKSFEAVSDLMGKLSIEHNRSVSESYHSRHYKHSRQRFLD